MKGQLRREAPTSIDGVEWDENKRKKGLAERGIDFVDAAITLFGRVLEYESERFEERRFVAIGPAPETDDLIAIVYTIRGAKLRIITARKARRNEQRAYLHAVSTAPDEGTQ